MSVGAADPASNDCPTRRIFLRRKKQAALTIETFFSKAQIRPPDDIVTPRTRTCPLVLMVSAPSLIAGPQPPSL